MNMVKIPEDELWTMPPPSWFKGKRVLELGNKKNQSGLYRDWYMTNGALYYICVDWNAQDGAISVDMGKKLPKDLQEVTSFNPDIVTNFGFTEHVYTDQIQCWFNLFAMAAKPGCFLSIVLPYPTHWDHHGVYQPTPGWLRAVLKSNGFKINTFLVNGNRRRWVTCIGAERVEEYNPESFTYPDPTYTPVTPHTCPLGKGIYITPSRRRVNRDEKNCGIE